MKPAVAFALVVLVLCAPVLLAQTTVPGPVGRRFIATETAVTPGDIAVDVHGDVYVADYVADRVFKIDVASGMIWSVAAGLMTQGSSIGITLDAQGDLYLADGQGSRVLRVGAQSGTATLVAGNGLWGFSGDGGRAQDAQLAHPFSVAVDALGNVFIAEWANHRVRMVDATSGIITTVAGNGSAEFFGDDGPAIDAGLPNPSAVAVDAAGNVLIADWANNDVRRIRRLDRATGIITTVAGNGTCDRLGRSAPAKEAGLCAPFDVAVDEAGNLYIADIEANSIRMVHSDTGAMTTIAGNGSRDFFGDGGPAAGSGLNGPISVAVDSLGNVFIGDAHNFRIRKIAWDTGIITTIAGNGTPSTPPFERRRVVRTR